MEENTIICNERIWNFCRAFNNSYNRARLTVVDWNGHVLGDSEENPEEMVHHTSEYRPEIVTALQGKFGQSRRISETLHESFPLFCRTDSCK